jgi:hypothetical protein
MTGQEDEYSSFIPILAGLLGRAGYKKLAEKRRLKKEAEKKARTDRAVALAAAQNPQTVKKDYTTYYVVLGISAVVVISGAYFVLNKK